METIRERNAATPIQRRGFAAFRTRPHILLALAVLAAAPPSTTPRFISLAGAFDRFAADAGKMTPDDQVRIFDGGVGAQLPGFYRTKGEPQALARRIHAAVSEYSAIRGRFLQAARLLERLHGSAVNRFRKVFPDYEATAPIYVVHSLGELDGGTRLIEGEVALIFGADVIAKLHDEASIGPLFDHELFHTYHRPLFGECDAVWCMLWIEGLATLVAAQMNSGASDRALLLEYPAPIRPALAGREADAICLILSKLDSTAAGDLGGLFAGNRSIASLPPRVGYWIGFRVASELARKASAAKLAHLEREQVRKEVEQTLRAMAPCPEH